MGTYWTLLSAGLRARIAELRRNPDAGYTTETVVITALLVVAALTVVTIIVGKVVTKANGINLGL
ncbi:MAG TPA: hypothetical protein VF003_00775 [Pseudonocardiaceae bacterium]